MKTIKMFLLYVVFAIFATFVNLFLQWIVFSLCASQYVLYYALGVGTLAGLIVKYFLDKKYVFTYASGSMTTELKSFLLYAFIGGVITLFYCVIEIAFYHLFSFAYSQYIGALIGLSLGYMVKFYFDKKLIFKKEIYE